MAQTLGKLKNKKIGGIPWRDLMTKRSDPSFDHISFWDGLSKEDKETLMLLLKQDQENKQEEGKLSSKLQQLMEKDELEEKREEVQKAGDEIKVLKEENQALKDKLKEKDKILRHLVKAQLKEKVANGELDRSILERKRSDENVESQVNVSKVEYEERKNSFEFSSGLNMKKKSLESAQEETPREFRVSPHRDKSGKKKKKDKKEKRDRSRSNSVQGEFATSPTR